MAFTEIGANTLDTGYDIENSLRFNSGDSPSLALTFGADGSATQFCVSMWVKRSRVTGTQQFLFSARTDGSNYGTIKFNGDNKIQVNLINSGSDQDEIVTNEIYRDVSAWYHLFFRFDKTQAALSNGIKLYVNNVLQTWGTTTYAQNEGYHFGKSGTPMTIGNYNAAESYAALYLSEVYYVEGELKNSTDFGEVNDNGVWIPKAYDGDFGDEGFFLEFKQTGTSQNASGIGADTSGNTNHFAVTNLAAADVTTDSPTNNWCTLNPLSDLNATLSEGNTQLVRNASSAVAAVATMAPANGKWYYEFQLSANNNAAAGVVDVDKWDSTTDVYDYDDSGAVAVLIESTDNFIADYTEDTAGGTRLQNSVQLNTAKYGFAVDLDNQGFYASANGNWYTGSAFDDTDFSNATNLANDIPAGSPMAFFARGSIASASYANFGNPGGADSISSGNSDANGYGNFEYAVPSGYYALCTKNLAEYG